MADQPERQRLVYTYDTYVCIVAETKEEADEKLADIESVIEHLGSSLTVFPAYGIEDAETGEEIRPVG